MNKSEDQFPVVKESSTPKTAPNIVINRTIDNQTGVRLRNKSADVVMGKNTIVKHTVGSDPVVVSRPMFSGKGKARDLGQIFDRIKNANPDKTDD